jgi:UDP-N-acetyl-D-mannosaminouronate:lipid I N-acetyl-D-mannosaminouronosyltransferase
MEPTTINGIYIYPFKSKIEFLEFIKDKKKILVAINAEKILNKDKRLVTIMNENIGYTDGVGAIIALKRNGVESVKIAGAEIWLDIINTFQDKKYYFIGSTDEVISETIEKLKIQFSGIQIVGFRNGFLNSAEIEELKKDLLDKKPDVVFVAQGSPRQELLMNDLKNVLPALYMGLGGSFDVYVGKVKRAPKIFINLHLEWFYRLLKQPTRLHRQFKIPLFLIKVLFNKY